MITAALILLLFLLIDIAVIGAVGAGFLYLGHAAGIQVPWLLAALPVVFWLAATLSVKTSRPLFSALLRLSAQGALEQVHSRQRRVAATQHQKPVASRRSDHRLAALVEVRRRLVDNQDLRCA